MMKRFTSRLGLLLAVITLLTPAVPAQVLSAGRLTGVVMDAQGAVIPNARIVAKHDQTQAEYTLKASDEVGWSIPSLPIGIYTVTDHCRRLQVYGRSERQSRRGDGNYG